MIEGVSVEKLSINNDGDSTSTELRPRMDAGEKCVVMMRLLRVLANRLIFDTTNLIVADKQNPYFISGTTVEAGRVLTRAPNNFAFVMIIVSITR